MCTVVPVPHHGARQGLAEAPCDAQQGQAAPNAATALPQHSQGDLFEAGTHWQKACRGVFLQVLPVAHCATVACQTPGQNPLL